MSLSQPRTAAQKQPPDPEPQMAARLVAIPKSPEPAAKKTEYLAETLRQQRLALGYDLYLIAEHLRIKPDYLIALEHGQYDQLPADAYVIGFLRSYANVLKLDARQAIDRYRYEMAGRRKKPVLSMPVPVSQGPAPTGIIMAAASVMALLIYGLWYGISSSDRAQVNVQSPLPALVQTQGAALSAAETATSMLSAPANTAAAAAAPAAAAPAAAAPVAGIAIAPSYPTVVAGGVPPAAPGIVLSADAQPQGQTHVAPKNAAIGRSDTTKTVSDMSSKNGLGRIYGDTGASRVSIRATQSSWVMITDDSGKAIFDRVLKTGDVYKVPGRAGLSLTTGNSSGITLSLDGVDLPSIARSDSRVARNIPLNPDQLINPVNH